MSKDRSSYIKIFILAVVLCAIPFLQSFGLIKLSSITTLGTVLFYALAAVGLNVLLGYSGLVSLGTAGFMGLGAYLTGYFAESSLLLGILCAILVPVVLGTIVGLVSLRLEGYYLAIATLGISEIFKTIFSEFDQYTGGFSGMNISYPDLFKQFDFFGIHTPKMIAYYVIVIVLIIILVITHNFIHSATGRAMMSMKGSPSAAQAMGINILKYKLIAFIVATIFASLAGVLYMLSIRAAFPTTWGLNLSLQILAVVIIGGSRTILGPLIGSLIVFGFPDLVFKQIPVISEINGISYIFTGALIIIVILFYPNGLIYIGHDIKKLFKKVKSNG